MPFELSVIIPVKNELKVGFIQEIMDSFLEKEHIEVLWVVSKNNDGTAEYLIKKNQKVFTIDSDSRASRINMGIQQAKAEKILLHHPRSLLTDGAIEELLALWQSEPAAWGGFTHEFLDNDHKLLNFTSYYSNKVRFDKSGVIYLDHCIFFPKKLLGSMAAIPNVDIFEDTLLSQILLRSSKPIRLKSISKTSPIRFERNGIWKQAIMNQILKLGYKLRISHKFMNKFYERGLSLNSAYTDNP